MKRLVFDSKCIARTFVVILLVCFWPERRESSLNRGRVHSVDEGCPHLFSLVFFVYLWISDHNWSNFKVNDWTDIWQFVYWTIIKWWAHLFRSTRLTERLSSVFVALTICYRSVSLSVIGRKYQSSGSRSISINVWPWIDSSRLLASIMLDCLSGDMDTMEILFFWDLLLNRFQLFLLSSTVVYGVANGVAQTWPLDVYG